MNWIRDNLPTVQGRLTAGVALVTAVTVGLWPDHARAVDPVRLGAAVVAGLAWLFAELTSVSKISGHDVALFQEITTLLNQNALSFLSQHDFHNNLHSRSTNPVHEIAEWHGSRYEFLDARLQKQWLVTWQKINDLSYLYGNNLVGTDRENILTAWHFGFSRADQPPQAHKEVKELNDAAQNLYLSFDKFAQLARRRLGS